MRARVDIGKCVGDDALSIDDIRNAASEAGIPCAIGFAEDIFGVTEQGELKTELFGKRFIGCNTVKACAQNLNIVTHKRVVVVTEPVPFPRSTGGAGFGVKPQHDFLATQLR